MGYVRGFRLEIEKRAWRNSQARLDNYRHFQDESRIDVFPIVKGTLAAIGIRSNAPDLSCGS